MKRFVLLCLVTLLCKVAVAQHSYYHYNSRSEISSVILLPHNGTTYVVSANKEKKEFAVGTLSGNCPQTQTINTLSAIQIEQVALLRNNEIVLNGGFFDGDDIFVYGAVCSGTYRSGFFAQLKCFLGAYSMVAYFPTTNEIFDGCKRTCTIQENLKTGMKYYYFAEKTAIIYVNESLSIFNRVNIQNPSAVSLSLDTDINDNLLIGVTTNNSTGIFKFDSAYPLSFCPNSRVRFVCLLNSVSFSSHTNAISKNRHPGFNDDIAYMAQDIVQNEIAGFWLGKINYQTTAIVTSNIYTIPSYSEVEIIEVENSFNYVYVLGMGISASGVPSKFIAEISKANPSSYTIHKILNIDFTFSDLQGVYEYGDLMFNNMMLSGANLSVFAGGAMNDRGYIVELNTLNSSCDSVLTSSCITIGYLDYFSPIDVTSPFNNIIPYIYNNGDPMRYSLMQRTGCIDCGSDLNNINE